MFCDSAVTYARGVLPHEDSELTAQQRQDFKEANILKKVIYHVHVLYEQTTQFIQSCICCYIHVYTCTYPH